MFFTLYSHSKNWNVCWWWGGRGVYLWCYQCHLVIFDCISRVIRWGPSHLNGRPLTVSFWRFSLLDWLVSFLRDPPTNSCLNDISLTVNIEVAEAGGTSQLAQQPSLNLYFQEDIYPFPLNCNRFWNQEGICGSHCSFWRFSTNSSVFSCMRTLAVGVTITSKCQVLLGYTD